MISSIFLFLCAPGAKPLKGAEFHDLRYYKPAMESQRKRKTMKLYAAGIESVSMWNFRRGRVPLTALIAISNETWWIMKLAAARGTQCAVGGHLVAGGQC